MAKMGTPESLLESGNASIYTCAPLAHADIAQLVEQRIRNAKVVGSTPIIGTRFSI